MEDLVPDSDTYTFVVTFERSRSDDLDIAKTNFPGLTDDDALLQQFALELQAEAYNNGGMSGSFKITATSLGSPINVRVGVDKANTMENK